MFRYASSAMVWVLLIAPCAAQQPSSKMQAPAKDAARQHRASLENPRGPEHMGSSYVPLDSWVYTALERLAALGYGQSAVLGLRPWTRLECARLLQEAAESLEQEGVPGNHPAWPLYRSLKGEFAAEGRRLQGDRNLAWELESLYTRLLGISGAPLADSYHFGQTVINDYGRPYQEGMNVISGWTSHAEAGPVAFYVRGEYQHAPGAPAYSSNLRQAISIMDGTDPLPAVAMPTRNQFRLLETYVAFNFSNLQFSFGKQSAWWGPSQGGPLMYSNNAEPFYMLRLTRVAPQTLPSFLGRLGPMRWDFFLGRLEGHRFPAHPYVVAQKISFKPTPNLELGFSKTTIFAGGSVPITWNGFYRATFSVSGSLGEDPGDRRGGFDFSYRIPGLRNWLVLYSDSLVDDDPSPLAAPRRAAINPGIYLTQIPGLRRLDLRVEAPYTDPPTGRSIGGKFIYWNGAYRDAHQDKGNLLGSWIGREGRGLQVWSTYWISGESTLRLGYRTAHVSSDFVPNGGRLSNFSGRVEIAVRRDWLLSGWLQCETWNYPVLAPGKRTDVAASIQMTFRPHWRVRK